MKPPKLNTTPIAGWPAARTAATYLGAGEYRGHHGFLDTQITKMVVCDWKRDDGATVAFCWPMPEMHVRLVDVASHFPGRDAYVVVNGGLWGLRGPELRAATGRDPGSDKEIEWSQVADVLGQPLPLWPFSLRIPHLVMGWQPGDEPVAYTPMLSINVDETVFLRLATLYPAGHAVHRTLINAVQAAQHGEDTSDERLLRDRLADGRISPSHIQLAAELVATPEVELEDVPETVRRDAWRQVLARSDRLAVDCVHNTADLPVGVRGDFPHAHTIEIRRSRHGQEFLARLEAAEYRAVFVMLHPDRTSTLWIDPDTDTPVTIEPDGRIWALAPNRLPSFSPLAELILDGDIWVRTQDGTLYPAPYDKYYGLSWGYGGSGPATLAVLAGRLLDDITAPGADFGDPDTNSTGLQELMQHDWPDGTVLTRTKLEAARAQ